MAAIVTTPTRMELTRLKGKLRTAQRGHKLLRDKQDELMKRFLDMVREARALRAQVEGDLMRVYGSFTMASALMGGEALEQALMYPKWNVELNMTTQNVMGVKVPRYEFKNQVGNVGDRIPYGFAATSGELDDAVEGLESTLPHMFQLAQAEKTVQLLAREIEKTRRRVNALEYMVIPNTQEAIRSIAMKLEENDRAITTRLMKVKDMLLEQAVAEQRAWDTQMWERF